LNRNFPINFSNIDEVKVTYIRRNASLGENVKIQKEKGEKIHFSDFKKNIASH